MSASWKLEFLFTFALTQTYERQRPDSCAVPIGRCRTNHQYLRSCWDSIWWCTPPTDKIASSDSKHCPPQLRSAQHWLPIFRAIAFWWPFSDVLCPPICYSIFVFLFAIIFADLHSICVSRTPNTTDFECANKMHSQSLDKCTQWNLIRYDTSTCKIEISEQIFVQIQSRLYHVMFSLRTNFL